MKKYIFGLLTMTLGVALTSCESFLDEVPDNRTEIDTPEKVQLLLVSGYPQSTPAVICELSGDNFVDNNVVKPGIHRSAYKDFHEEAYAWKDINNYGTGEDDTPYDVWEKYYYGIATANHAIAAMKEMSNDPANDPSLAHSWGEAHVLRAYLHFVLVNVFAEAYKDETRSLQDMGIPYVTEPETTVNIDYSTSKYRHSVAETYDLIEKDLLEGINLIDDSKYKVPAYHFNQNAAHAFAARFYLYKRQWAKVIEHANFVLGTDNNTLLNMMMDYSVFENCSSGDDYSQAWQHPERNNNLMLMTTGSLLQRRSFGYRYSIAGPKAREIFLIGTNHPLWSSYYVCPIAIVSGMCFGSSSNDYGYINSKIFEQFEYSDKIAGIGYPHIILRAFTANELLLERAEAKCNLLVALSHDEPSPTPFSLT